MNLAVGFCPHGAWEETTPEETPTKYTAGAHRELWALRGGQ